MNLQRIAGLGLVVVGVILTVIGINASHSFNDQVSDMFRGKFTDSTSWYIFGGIVVTAVGLGCAGMSWRGKRA